MDNKVYIHGGFEPEAPSIPTDIINNLDLKVLFSNNVKLKAQCEVTDPKQQMKNSSKSLINNRPNSSDSFSGETVQIQWNRNATVSQFETGKNSEVMMNNLQELTKKVNKQGMQYIKLTDAFDNSVVDSFLKELLRPKEWKPSGISFCFSSDLIKKLCLETSNVLMKQPIVLKVNGPIKIFGDIHGQ